MNLSVSEMDGYGLCVVSQFTLYGDARKGRRPSYSHAADPATGERMYDDFIRFLKERGFTTVSGRFRQFMEVEYKNMGPITILLDSKKQF